MASACIPSTPPDESMPGLISNDLLAAANATQPMGAQEFITQEIEKEKEIEPASQSTIPCTPGMEIQEEEEEEDATMLVHTPDISASTEARQETKMTRNGSWGKIQEEREKEALELDLEDPDDALLAEFGGTRFEERHVFERQAFTLYDTFGEGDSGGASDSADKPEDNNGSAAASVENGPPSIEEQAKEAEGNEVQALPPARRITEQKLSEHDVLMDMEDLEFGRRCRYSDVARFRADSGATHGHEVVWAGMPFKSDLFRWTVMGGIEIYGGYGGRNDEFRKVGGLTVARAEQISCRRLPLTLDLLSKRILPELCDFKQEEVDSLMQALPKLVAEAKGSQEAGLKVEQAMRYLGMGAIAGEECFTPTELVDWCPRLNQVGLSQLAINLQTAVQFNPHAKRYFYCELLEDLRPFYSEEILLKRMGHRDLLRLNMRIRTSPHLLCFRNTIDFRLYKKDRAPGAADEESVWVSKLPELTLQKYLLVLQRFQVPEANQPKRYEAAVRVYHALKTACYEEKHTYLPTWDLKARSGCTDMYFREALDVLLELNVLHEDTTKQRTYLSDMHDHDLCVGYAWAKVMRTFAPEEPAHVAALRQACHKATHPEVMCDEQKEALEAFLRGPFTFVNGRAGSGKSAFLRQLVNAAALLDLPGDPFGLRVFERRVPDLPPKDRSDDFTPSIFFTTFMGHNAGDLNKFAKGLAMTTHSLLQMHAVTCNKSQSGKERYRKHSAREAELKGKTREQMKSWANDPNRRDSEGAKNWKRDRMIQMEQPWMQEYQGLCYYNCPFEGVKTLVIDECVCVCTHMLFTYECRYSTAEVETLGKLLAGICQCSQPGLRRVIMVGDVKQLWSIRPGNLLTETEQVMRQLSSFVSFQHNHRAESAILDDNARAIAAKEVHKIRFDGRRAIHMNLGDRAHEDGSWDQDGPGFRQRRFERCRDLVLEAIKRHELGEYDTQIVTRTRDCARLINLAVEQYYFERGPALSHLYGGMAPSRIRYQPKGIGISRKVIVKRNLYELDIRSGQVMRVMRIEDICTYKGGAEMTVEMGHTSQQSRIPPTAPPGLPPGAKPEKYERRLVLLPLGADPADKTALRYLPWNKDTRPLVHKASASTVHGVQGKQLANIVYVIPYPCKLEDNPQVYTGSTRAKEREILVGPLDAFADAILRDPPMRRTDLAEKFFVLLEKQKAQADAIASQRSLLGKRTQD